MDLETQIKNDKGYREKLSTSFMFEIKPRLRELDPKKYSNVNLLTRDLIALKPFYNGKIPLYKPEDDAAEFKKSLKMMEEKKSKSFSVRSEEYDNISDDEPPTKKGAMQQQQTTQQTATWPNYEHYYYTNSYYDPRMFQMYAPYPSYYHQSYQPPLPTYPPPCSSPPPPPSSTPPASPEKEN